MCVELRATDRKSENTDRLANTLLVCVFLCDVWIIRRKKKKNAKLILQTSAAAAAEVTLCPDASCMYCCVVLAGDGKSQAAGSRVQL